MAVTFVVHFHSGSAAPTLWFFHYPKVFIVYVVIVWFFSTIFQASRESESEPLVEDVANGNNDVPSEQNVLHIFLPIKNV